MDVIRIYPLNLIETSMNVQLTGHDPKNQKVEKPICYDLFNNLSVCPTENCEVSATTKRSIKRRLKNCKK